MALIVYAGAERERARWRGNSVFPFAVDLGDLLDRTVGSLNAPVSTSTLAALKDTDMTTSRWPIFL
jgi:hypothetical protein